MAETSNRYCAQCGTEVGLALVCPQCQALVYAEQLQKLAADARLRESQRDFAGAVQNWRQSLILLPQESVQAQAIEQRIRELELKGEDHEAAHQDEQKKNEWLKKLGPLAFLGAMAWKFKGILLLVWTKGKFLLFGLSKLKTFATMFATWGLYFALYGWLFALGFVVGIYVHEMGHVWRTRRFGLQVTAPMFIPGFGAFVMREGTQNVGQAARISLGGPVWGLGAAIVSLAIAWLTGERVWMAVAQVTAWLNLFNLIPLFIFDGNEALRALTRAQRIQVLVIAALMGWISGVLMLWIIAAGVAWRTWQTKDHAEVADRPVLMQWALLLVLLGILSMIDAHPLRG